jgi:type IV pilus biogenesis protein CpaD/CtpE
MKRKVVLLLAVISLYYCTKSSEYYHGYVYDSKTHQPISNVKVEAAYDMKLSSYTDEKGYFKIKKEQSLAKFLIVHRPNSSLDTIQTFAIQHGELEMHFFVEGRNDTIFID